MTARPIITSLVIAVLLVAASAALKYAQGIHAIGPDIAARGVQVLMGLVLVFYANAIPKMISPSRGATEAAGRVQTAQRVAGWAFAIAGLAYAAMGAFAPMPIADTVSTVAVGGAVAITLCYAAWACTGRLRGGTGQREA